VVEGAAWAWLTVTGLAWLLAPALPGAVAELLERRRHGPDPAQRHLLHLARDSWRAFERLPGDDPQALPPEQLALGAVLRPSHRSNPATLGLTLLATACAHRLGLIGTRDLIQRLGSGLDALERLPREHGHLHQWTDTHTRAVLAPARIDTVQSGVLAACLWATAQACRELAGGPAPHAARETALNAALARLRHGGDPGLRELLQQAPLQALLAQDLWALWRRSPGKLRTLLAAAQVASGAPAPLQHGPLADLLGQLDSLLSDREDDRDRWPARLRSLATRLDALVDAIDFTLLYDPHRRLLHTGLRTDDALREEAVHDSLLGAARLAGFVGIAKGDLPAAHWAALDRRLPAEGADADPGSALAQALLPGLLLDEPPGSVLQRGAAAALAAAELPDEGNGQPRRVAPWLALLALPVDPEGALARLQRLERLGARSAFGLVSSLTLPAGPEGRRPPPQPSDTVVLAELAAGLAAITWRLAEGAPRRWFGAVPAVRAHLPLLQEAPRPGLRLLASAPPLPMPAAGRLEAPPVRELDPTHLPPAQAPTQLLGNGRYWVALQPHGGGCSRWQGRDVHRWHDDLLRGHDGHWLLLRSGDEVEYHSLTRAPHPRPDAFYRTRFHDDRVEYDADCDFWRSTVTAWVGADEDIEFRQVSLQNLEAHPVAFELLSVVDVSLAPADLPVDQAAAQPPLKAEAADAGTLLFKRAAADDGEPWCVAHFLARCDAEPVSLRLIADRRRLLPRRGDLSQARPGAGQGGELPARLDTGGEPVAAIAVRLVVPAQSRLCVTFATSAGRDPETLRAWADEFRRDVHLQRSRRMASALLRLRQHSWQLDAADHDALQDLCTGLVASRAQARPLPAEPADPQRLSRLGLNLPAAATLLLVRLPSRAGVPAVQTLRRACRAWGAAGLEVMLAVIDATPMDVEQRVLGALPPLRHDLAAEDLGAPQERLHLWRADSLAPGDLAALQAAARVDLVADGQPLARVVSAAWRASTAASRAAAAAAAGHDDPAVAPDRRQRAALVEAPLAGEPAPWRFVDGGRALTLHLDRRRTTPEAWRLSLGGPHFGARVSESGGGHTWAGTPPRPLTTPGEDPLLDPPVEHFLLQDLATRETWGLLPTLDRNGLGGYELRLEPGRARWRQQRGPLAIEAELWVHPEAPAKLLQVRLHNDGPGERVLRAAAMVEWMLGGRRATRLTALNEFVPALPAVLAQQRAGGDDPLPGVALLMLVGLAAQQWTASRDEWFDTAGRLRLPRTLAGADGGALDPCAALDATLTLAPGERAEFAWVLAHAADREQALALGAELGSLDTLRAAAAQVDTLAPRGVGGLQLQVQTPDIHFDALVNHWLPWQLRWVATGGSGGPWARPAAAHGARAAGVVAAAAALTAANADEPPRPARARRNGPRLTLSPWAAFCRASPAHDEADGLRRKPRRAAPFAAASDEAALQLYKLAVEGVLGCRLQGPQGERISVAPALPAAWPRALVCITRGAKVLWLHLREPSLAADGDSPLQRLAPGTSLAWDELPAESHWLVQSPSSQDAEDRRPPRLVEA
jgi:cyclic beta-1,2-glucan synthetase